MVRGTIRKVVAVTAVLGMAAVIVAVLGDGGAPAAAAPREDRTSARNPDLDAACGIDIHVMLDESSSIDQFGATADVRRAFRAFVGALRNTGSRLAVSEMGTQARMPLPGLAARAYTEVTDASIASVFEPYITTGYSPPPIGSGTQYTNWEDAMRVGRFALDRPRPDVPHLVIFITDGDPTAAIRQNQVTSGQYTTQFPLTSSQVQTGVNNDVALSPAIPNANAMKAQGSHILAVGVGRALGNDASLGRLVDIAGPAIYPDDGPFDISTTDVYREADFGLLEEALREAAFQLCAPSVNIRKQLDLNADPAVDDLVPGEGWTFEAEVQPTPATWVLPDGASGPTASASSGPGGFANLQWTTAAPVDSTITVSELAQPGFAYDPVATTCSYITPDDVVSRPLPGFAVTSDGFTATVPDEAIVTCDVINRLVPAPSVVLDKYTNGADADDPPGIAIHVGNSVTWTYRVFNDGNVPLSEIAVADDQGESVTCPATTLEVGEFLTCTATGVATPGQYSNVGTVTATGAGTPVGDTDPSHYVGVVPGLSIEKSTNGEPATDAPGPFIEVGDPVTWTYEVANIGTTVVVDIAVTDDRGVVVSCPFDVLPPSGSMTCTASGIATSGQYENIARVTGTDTAIGESLEGADVSHYFGLDAGISLVKTVNGEDANTAPGPLVAVGDQVVFRFQVTNTGNVPLSWVIVDPDVPPIACPSITLLPGTSTTCFTAAPAAAGQQLNDAMAIGTTPAGTTVDDTDPANYYGAAGSISIDKFVEGDDADEAPGPVLPVGSPVTWTYEVTNTGNVALDDVTVTDTRGVVVTCPATTLGPAVSMTCVGSGTVAAGQYTNFGVATGTTTLGLVVRDEDPANHFGGEPGIDIEKLTDGLADLDAPPGVFVEAGTTVEWTFIVTNTGNLPLSQVTASDDQLGPLTCPATTLAVGASMTCTATSTATVGQHTNRATATGVDSNDDTVTDEDDSNHFGVVRSIEVRKLVNGVDANTAPGLEIPVGDEVVMTFEVRNRGNIALLDVEVTDDVGLVPTFTGGDADGDGELDPGEVWTYEASMGPAAPGRFDNVATVTAHDGLENQVADTDPANAGTGEVGDAGAAGLAIRKDATRSPIASGETAEFRITVTNTGAVVVTGVVVTDEQVPACGRIIGDLAAGASVSYTCSVRLDATMVNVAVVTGDGAGAVASANDSATVVVASGSLATTGTNSGRLVVLGVVLLGAGVTAVGLSRWRRRI